MTEGGILSLFGVAVGTVLISSGAIWYKLGAVEKAVKNACPFGGCPFFKGSIKNAEKLIEQENGRDQSG